LAQQDMAAVPDTYIPGYKMLVTDSDRCYVDGRVAVFPRLIKQDNPLCFIDAFNRQLAAAGSPVPQSQLARRKNSLCMSWLRQADKKGKKNNR
jgi:hypothetical protein